MTKQDSAMIRSFLWWVFMCVLVLNCIFFFNSKGHCQSYQPKSTTNLTHVSLHTDRDEWEDSIGVTFITVTSFDDRLIYYYVTRKFTQRLSSVAWDENTTYQLEGGKKTKELKEKTTGCFMMMYCKTHLMAYLLVQLKCTEVL